MFLASLSASPVTFGITVCKATGSGAPKDRLRFVVAYRSSRIHLRGEDGIRALFTQKFMECPHLKDFTLDTIGINPMVGTTLDKPAVTTMQISVPISAYQTMGSAMIQMLFACFSMPEFDDPGASIEVRTLDDPARESQCESLEIERWFPRADTCENRICAENEALFFKPGDGETLCLPSGASFPCVPYGTCLIVDGALPRQCENTATGFVTVGDFRTSPRPPRLDQLIPPDFVVNPKAPLPLFALSANRRMFLWWDAKQFPTDIRIAFSSMVKAVHTYGPDRGSGSGVIPLGCPHDPVLKEWECRVPLNLLNFEAKAGISMMAYPAPPWWGCAEGERHVLAADSATGVIHAVETCAPPLRETPPSDTEKIRIQSLQDGVRVCGDQLEALLDIHDETLLKIEDIRRRNPDAAVQVADLLRKVQQEYSGLIGGDPRPTFERMCRIANWYAALLEPEPLKWAGNDFRGALDDAEAFVYGEIHPITGEEYVGLFQVLDRFTEGITFLRQTLASLTIQEQVVGESWLQSVGAGAEELFADVRTALATKAMATPALAPIDPQEIKILKEQTGMSDREATEYILSQKAAFASQLEAQKTTQSRTGWIALVGLGAVAFFAFSRKGSKGENHVQR